MAEKAVSELQEVHLTHEQEQKLLDVFKFFDKSSSNQIEVLELRNMLSQFMGTTPSAEKIQEMIQKHGIDLKGKLNFSSFRKLILEYMVQTTKWNPLLHTQVSGYVGFDQVLNQYQKDLLKHGVEFNIMLVGESGLGKSTMINTLFLSKLRDEGDKEMGTLENEFKSPMKTVEIHSTVHVIEEKGVRLKLTTIDTPGFGDKVNNSDCWKPIEQYVNAQMDNYFEEETSINRKKKIPDTKVHCCIYFLAPTGHCLKPLDIEFMKRLQNRVNIVPVIAKADTLTVLERAAFKQRIREDLEFHNIRTFPYSDDVEDEIQLSRIREIRSKIPFAVVGSDKQVLMNGQHVLGRKTKWGFIEIENEDHCEFLELRNLIIRSHLHDLIETTRSVHYENYRTEKLLSKN
eukprot:Sdes_comp22653_c0_seq1m21076